MKRALVSGISGQDGSYLAELLLEKGYEVHGIIRRSSSINTWRLDAVFDRLHLYYADVTDAGAIMGLVQRVKPDEIYHLAAQSHVRVSFDAPVYTTEAVALGTANMLEALRQMAPEAAYYQASSSEMFGSAPAPQNEATVFRPRSPYACAKVYAFHLAQLYREAYGLRISNGILFNHESPRRGETFVSRKIAKAVAAIKKGKQKTLALGNLDARRDWGYAPEYVEAMWRMLRQESGDFAIATGEANSVREFAQVAFRYVGLDFSRYATIDSRLMRPAEVDNLCGDASKAAQVLGWKAKVRFGELVRLMVEAEL